MSAISSRSTSNRRLPAGWCWAGLAGALLWLGGPGAMAVAQAQAESATPPATRVAELAATGPLLFIPGEVQTVAVAGIERVAIGNPEVADVTIVSPSELLVQARQSGSTNLIVWDAQGQREVQVTVLDPAPTAVAEYLPDLIKQVGLPEVRVEVRGGKVFLVGRVGSEEQMAVVEAITSTYDERVVNLVTVSPAAAPPEPPAPLVKLSVQVIELNRTELDHLGIEWSESVTFTEAADSDVVLSKALMRFGTDISRGSFSAKLNALVELNKARVLSEPSLVTASGKEASSFIGVEVPVIEDASLQSGQLVFSIDFRETGVVLKMTPTVLPEEATPKITTALQAEVSAVDETVALDIPVGSTTVKIPGFKVRKAETEVTTASGETIVIAGLLDVEDKDTVKQLPGLGNIPVVGRLFRSPKVESSQLELIITVTPELVADAGSEMDRILALEEALAVAEVTASADGDPRLRYALDVQEHIAQGLEYPEPGDAPRTGGTVKLRLHLFADGTLDEAVVSQSSGHAALDLSALEAAESRSPYPAFPRELIERELWVEVPLLFRP